MIQKKSINLFQPQLLPKKEKVTLTRLVLVAFLILILMVLWSFFSVNEVESLNKQYNQLVVKEQEANEMLAQLQVQLGNKKQDPALLAKLNTLKAIMSNKQALHAKLTDPNKTYVAGFAQAMTELAKYHHNDISLSKVVIAQDEISFNGLAKNASAVPQWLAGFEHSNFLSGKNFTYFKIFENEQKLTAFEISSNHVNTSFSQPSLNINGGN